MSRFYPACVGQPKTGWRSRQLTAVTLMLGGMLALSACGSSEAELSKGSIGYVEGFMGAVVADEPRASLVGRNILSSGGTAADAASAMYFTLAVTLPSRAGLGGNGMCLAYDAATGKTETLDFIGKTPKVSANADRPTAVPGNPRGFYALQARYGRLDWRSIVTPGENLARLGSPVSRTFSRDLKVIGPVLLADKGARAMFAGKNSSNLAKEGEKIEQLDLAATLGMLRARGVGPFYTGPFAANFVQAVTAAGGSLTVNELRQFSPKWRETVRVEVGNEIAHFAPPPAAAATQSAILLAMLVEDGHFEDEDEGGRAHVLAQLAARSFADRETWLSADGQGTKAGAPLVASKHIETLVDDLRLDGKTDPANFVPAAQNRREAPASTSFSAVDADGNAVACAVGMNARFGTGRVAAGTGVLLAAAPDIYGRGAIGLAVMIMVNENSKEFRMAATANGGVYAPTALAGVVARIALMEQSAKAALAAPRVHNGGDPDVTYYEPGLDAGALSHLSALGHRVDAAQALGLVNVLYCPEGLPTTPQTCEMATDPRGTGLASGSMH